MQIELFYSLSVLLIFIHLIDSRQIFNPSSQWNKVPGEPGVRIRLTKKGINYVKSVGVRLLNEQLANLSGYNTSFPFSQPGIEGLVYLNNVRMLQYIPPQVSVVNFLPPRNIVFGLENMAISLSGDFFGTGGAIQVAGSVDGSISDMTIALTAEFTSTIDGQMDVKVQNCSTIIGGSNFNINPQGPIGPFLKTMQGFINDGIRGRVPGMFCKKLKFLIEDNSPKLFAKLTKTKFSEHFPQNAADDNGVLEKFMADFVRGLIIDNRNIAHPSVTYDYFETQMKGEVRYEDNDYPTPFYPKAMHIEDEADRMLYFYASDYLFNSLLYHAYQTNKLSISLNKNNLPEKYRNIVSTECRGGSGGIASTFCVGKLIPPIAKAYPNTTTSFVIIPHGLPDFSFNGNAGIIKLSTRILTYVNDDGIDRQIMVSSADGQADLLLSAANGKLGGDLSINHLDVHLHRSSIPGIDPTAIERLTPLAKTFLGPQLSQALKKGTPFPLQESVTFIQPDLRIHNGFVQLSTDFLLNESSLRQKIAETFRDVQL